MKVADLIHLLQQNDPAAIVVLWDRTPYEGRVSKLGIGEVQPIQLGARESIGPLLFEPWVNGSDDLHCTVRSLALSLGASDAPAVLGHQWHPPSKRVHV